MEWIAALDLTLDKLSSNNNRILPYVNILILVLLILTSTVSSCFSHEEQPSVADFEVTNLTLSMKIATNLETLLSQSSDDLNAVILDEVQRAGKYSIVDLSSVQINELLVRSWPFLNKEFFFKANQDDLQLNLTNISIEFDEVREAEKNITIFVSAQIPVGSEYLTFGWAKKFGDLVLREQGSRENLYSGYLSTGETSPELPLSIRDQSSRSNQFFSYVVSGLYHIIPIGFDHILFIIGLFLVSNQLRSLIFQVSLFTFAHTITLGLASFEIISISSSVVEPIIAASIIYIGLENYFMRERNNYRNILIFVFGLLHGLGFAGVLTSLELTSEGILIPLLAFNIGVELGQILVLIFCFVGFGYWFADKIWYYSRVVRPISVILVLTGLFWLIERTI